MLLCGQYLGERAHVSSGFYTFRYSWLFNPLKTQTECEEKPREGEGGCGERHSFVVTAEERQRERERERERTKVYCSEGSQSVPSRPSCKGRQEAR
jgi:hypothetical protein